MKRRTLLESLAIASLLASTTGLASAQNAWPARAITMVVPFPPGGLADLVARPVAEAMSRDLGQAVIIENKGGAGGGIGMGLVAKAKPDGYTILMALSSLTVLPEADTVLARIVRPPCFCTGYSRGAAKVTIASGYLSSRRRYNGMRCSAAHNSAGRRKRSLQFGQTRSGNG